MSRIRTITNIEFASVCNNACAYCPASRVGEHRFAGLMDGHSFEAALSWIHKFVKAGTQRELNLFGIGESTLHPDLPYFVAEIRKIHPGGHLRLNTNGILMNRQLAKALKEAGITDIHVTDHDAAVTLMAIQELKAEGIPCSTNRDFVTGPNTWAGQIKWQEPEYQFRCAWLLEGQAMILADGGVVTCCIDYAGTSLIGSVFDDDLDQKDRERFALCDTCHHWLE